MSESLADKVIARQEAEARNSSQIIDPFFSYDLPERDEYGMPTANCLDYVIARILYIDCNISGRERLHLREDDRIWEGDHWVAEDDKTLYRITRWGFKPFTQVQKIKIWARLRECLPTLSYDKFVVKDNLVWDAKNSELYFTEDEPLTIN